MINKTELKARMETYSCNYKKNTSCKKNICKYLKKGECYRTTKWQYARKTPLNYIKKLLILIKFFKCISVKK